MILSESKWNLLLRSMTKNTVIDRGDRRQREGGKNTHRKEHCIKINLQKLEVIMNSLIPLEFHRASNDEPQPLKLLWNERLVLKCRLKWSIHFKQFVNKEQCFDCLYRYNLTLKSQIEEHELTLRESGQESNATRFKKRKSKLNHFLLIN